MTAPATELGEQAFSSRGHFHTASAPPALLQPLAGASGSSSQHMPGSYSSSSSSSSGAVVGGAGGAGAAGSGGSGAEAGAGRGGGFDLSPLEQLVAFAQDTLREARPAWRPFSSLRALQLPRFDQITARAEANLRVYNANYKVVCGAWAAVAVALAFGSFLVAGLMLMLLERWVRAKLRSEGTLDINARTTATVCILAIIWITGVGECVVFAAFWSAICVGLHAVLHERPSSPDEIEISDV